MKIKKKESRFSPFILVSFPSSSNTIYTLGHICMHVFKHEFTLMLTWNGNSNSLSPFLPMNEWHRQSVSSQEGNERRKKQTTSHIKIYLKKKNTKKKHVSSYRNKWIYARETLKNTWMVVEFDFRTRYCLINGFSFHS